MEGKTLQLPLIKKWFDLTKSGVKKEEYRELNAFWMARLLLQDGRKQPQQFWNRCYTLMYSPSDIQRWFNDTIIHKITPVPFTQNKMTLGYPKSGDTERTVTFAHAGIEIRTGNPDWGAEPGKLYIVIKHGERVNENPL